MTNINGVMLFETNEPLSLPEDFPPIPDDKTSKFGFKILDKGTSKEWVHATEADVRATLTRLGKSSTEIEAVVQRQLAGPGCFFSGNSCAGYNCAPGVRAGCVGSYDASWHIISCLCLPTQ